MELERLNALLYTHELKYKFMVDNHFLQSKLNHITQFLFKRNVNRVVIDFLVLLNIRVLNLRTHLKWAYLDIYMHQFLPN